MTADRLAALQNIGQDTKLTEETTRRAALVREMLLTFVGSEGSREDGMSAAIDLIRAEVLEEAARVVENDCHDDMTRAEEAAAIRALKGDNT